MRVVVWFWNSLCCAVGLHLWQPMRQVWMGRPRIEHRCTHCGRWKP